MTVKTCLRCDWEGETRAARCPDCEVPLYLVAAPTRAKVVSAAASADEPAPEAALAHGREERASSDSRAPTPSSAPLEPALPSRRPIAAIVAITLVLILGVGGWLGARDGRRPAPPASPTAAASISTVLDAGAAVVVPPVPPALDPTVGETTFSFAGGTPGWEEWEFSITRSILGPQGAEAIIFWTGYPDDDRVSPCGSLRNGAGSSAADLAAEMASARGTELVGGPTEVTIGGRPAEHLELIVREHAGCDPGYFFRWPHDQCLGACWLAMDVGYRIDLWIVQGADTPIVFEAATSTQADAELERDIRRIVRSIRFHRPPPPDFVLDLDSGATAPLPGIIDGSGFAASPDGSMLAYVAQSPEGTSQILVADLDGSRVRRLTSEGTVADSPAWSPDGRTIAYEGSVDGIARLFVLDVASGESTQITDELYPQSGLQFTPDGSAIVYTGGSGAMPELWTVPLAGGESTPLVGYGWGGMHDAGNGALSPDGSLVTMMGSKIGGPGAIRFVANVDGTHVRVIGERAGGSNPAGTWSPDGTRIVCTDYGGTHVLVVDVATGTTTTVANGSAAIWLDDHTLLVEA